MTHERDPNNQSNLTPKDEQRTPPSLFKKLDERFNFGLDVAASDTNHLCEIYFTKKMNALECPWGCVSTILKDILPAWCNPPYSRGLIGPFVEKAYLESIKGAIVVMLLPADISTGWFDYCMFAAEWIRITSRVHFLDENGIPSEGSPKFGSLAVVFDEKRRQETGYLIVSEMDWK